MSQWNVPEEKSSIHIGLKNEKAWQVGEQPVVQCDWTGVEGGEGREGHDKWTEAYGEGPWF